MTKELRNKISRNESFALIQIAFAIVGIPVFLGACASIPQETSWITVGQTTKEEVVERYGEPDLVVPDKEGETVTYRPRVQKPNPSANIPTVQAGPLGTFTTKTESIEYERSSTGLRRELRIHYDARGIVKEVNP